MRHGRSDLLRGTELADAVSTEVIEEQTADADDLVADLEALGPTFIKLGQLLSTRADLLPRPYLHALSRLQDQVEPLDFATVEATVANELGAPPADRFAHFDPEPLAAASLAQVHQAVLPGGREVAVKVQRPAIQETVVTDLEVLGTLADLLDRHTELGQHYRFAWLHAEFRRSLLRELDFKLEARNLATLGRNLSGFPSLVVPQPVGELTTQRLLTMDFVPGEKIPSVRDEDLARLDGRALADELLSAYLRQILVDGFFHADPHPGNVLLTADDRLALIDLGMTARLPQSQQERIVRMLVAVNKRDADDVAAAAADLGTPAGDFSHQGLASAAAELLGRADGAEIGELEIGTLMLELSRVGAEHGLRPAPEIALLGKTLLNLDEIARTLAPDIEPNEVVRSNIAGILSARVSRDATGERLLQALLDAREFVQQLPGRMNRIMDTVAEGQLEVKVDAIDEHELMRMAQKVANRVTAGLVLAALIVGASLLMQVDVEPTLLGYPALAIVLFLAAAGAGFGLLLLIVFGDQRGRR